MEGVDSTPFFLYGAERPGLLEDPAHGVAKVVIFLYRLLDGLLPFGSIFVSIVYFARPAYTVIDGKRPD
ncbi:hypothetical protein DLM86_00175 [Paenibacillus flagellatus]|uniref:Uncharacterized protein n=1 Tax=Paenibacillus flagellatus TaxID=2211139 RepID=A0A2V5KBI1_9BACL|nr:hypothetical protein DLM86_00175 [Paenibacillus flagellatus]